MQIQRRDAGGDPGRLDQGVVAGVGARECVARDGDGLAVADILVGEDTGAAGCHEGDGVARDRGDSAAADRRSEQRVVGLVGGGGARDHERQRGDVRGDAGGLGQGVVAGVGSGKAVTRDADRLTRADVLIGEDPCPA